LHFLQRHLRFRPDSARADQFTQGKCHLARPVHKNPTAFVLAKGVTTTVRSGGAGMDRVEERMAYVEGRLEEQSLAMTDVR
jgi:hypothetical protein